MESGLRLLLLTAVALGLGGCGWLPWRDRAPADTEVVGAESTAPPAVIQPEVERSRAKPPKIDTEDWEVGAYVGSLSVEDFEVNPVYGARFAYHISEDFFAEGIVGRSDAGLTSFERLSGSALLLTDSERRFTYYSLGFGWNALPGEVFLGRNRAFPTSVYFTAGVGSTRFAGDDRFTLTVGAGCRVLVTDSIAAHLTLRDHWLEVDVIGTSKTTHNYEATLGLSWFF